MTPATRTGNVVPVSTNRATEDDMIEYFKIGTAVYRVVVDSDVAVGRVYFDPERGTWTARDLAGPVRGFDTRADAAEWLAERHFNIVSDLVE